MELRKFLPVFDPAKLIPAAFVQPQPKTFGTTRYISVVWAALVTFALLYSAVPAQASSSGISGMSGMSGSTCKMCHSTSTTNIPTITLTGPTSVTSGSTSMYTLSVNVLTSGQGGLDVAASAGTFAAGTGTKVMNGEITHTSPSSSHSWTFSWTAPTVTTNTNVTLYAASTDSFGGGTGTLQRTITVTPAAPAPTIGVSPASLTFNFQSGGATPAAQTIAVSSSGTALSYTVSTSAAWLSATPASGSTSGNVSVSVNPSGLAVGTYSGNVTITSASASNSPKAVGVTLNVTAAPTLNTSPASLTFAYQIGGSNPVAQMISLSSTGGNVNYTTGTSATWLSVTPASGTTPGNLSVSVNPSGLAAGTYTGNVTITSAGASNSPKTVGVTLNISAAPALNSSPSTLTFTYQVGGSNPAAQMISLSSTGSNVNYTTGSSATWLSVTPASGTTPGNLSVSVNPSGLAAGTYTGNVTVTAAGASNSPKTVGVTLNVTAAALPTIGVNPTSLTFAYQIGGSTPAGQMVAVSSNGSAINYTTATSATWLAATPASGTTAGNVTVSVNPSGLAAGTYTGNVTLTSSGASNSPKAIPVTLTVSAAQSPTMTLSPLNLSFSYQSGGAMPAAKTVNVTSSSALSYTASSSGGWLGVSPASGNTPGALSVSVNPSGLATGTYNGSIMVTGSGASNSPQTVAVSLTVTAAQTNPSLSINPGTVSFSYAAGTNTSGTQNLSVTSTGAALNISATASGGAWLTVTPSTGSTPATLKVSANTSGLAAGTYNGTITITSTGAANSPQTVPVQLVVTSGTSSGRLRVWPSRGIDFEYQAGRADPSPRTIRVSSSRGPLSFTAAAYGGTWISVSPSGGTTPGTVSVSVDPTGLTSGTYTGNVYIGAQGSAGVSVPVTLRVVSGRDDDDGGGDDDLTSTGDLHAWPYGYDPAGSNTVAATWMDGTGAASATTTSTDTRNQGLLLSKTSHASNQAQAGVVIRDVEGMSLTDLGYDMRQSSQCTARSPRFVVVTTDEVVHKIGCASGTTQPAPAAGWKRLRFDPTNSAQATPAIAPGSKVKSMYLVLDDGPEAGASIAVLDNIKVNGKTITKQ